MIETKEIRVEKLFKLHKTEDFDCGDYDLNDFLRNDALVYQEKKIAVTFIFSYHEKIIGFFCCSSDAIRLKEEEKKTDNLCGKQIHDFPAIKVGRLARDKVFSKQKIGSFILKSAIGYVESLSNSVGVRYVTVDAYPQRAKWYQDHGFVCNLEKKGKKYASMRFDLFNLKNQAAFKN